MSILRPQPEGGGASQDAVPDGTPSAAAGEPVVVAPPQADPKGKRTRVSAAWAGVLAAAIVLVLLLIFILENGSRVKVSYFGASGHLPLGVALLLAAVAGALIVGIIGVARVSQLRLTARRQRRSRARER